MRDLYAVLGVDPAADARVVTLAYRRLCRRYHPDVCRDVGAGARIREINAAYEVLGDAKRRIAYDRSRIATASPNDAWTAAYRAWRESARPPGAPKSALRVVPASLDFGFLGSGEIAVRPLLLRGHDAKAISARVLTRGDWLRVGVTDVYGDEVSLDVQADPRDLHAFWGGSGPQEARVDGWLELVTSADSVRVPAGAILRRDAQRATWWNPFARKVG